MGTHPNGPARLFDNSAPLDTLIASDPERYLGKHIRTKWPQSTQLPYLFKILSIAAALPLQAHPDKGLAEALHQRDPNSFVDANHKPEIAVAIGSPVPDYEEEGIAFTGFVGFQPLEEIRYSLHSIPELWLAIGNDELVDSFIKAPSTALLKKVYTALITRPKEDVEKQVRALAERLSNSLRRAQPPPDPLGSRPGAYERGWLMLKVEGQYPGDVGALATVFFMNFVKLKRGEAVYIGADEVHAYLEGGASSMALSVTRWCS